MSVFRTLAFEHGRLILLDQTRLPLEAKEVAIDSLDGAAVAIETLVVRGAPAIGVAAAFAMVLGARAKMPLADVAARLRRTRPTAVNLFWAIDRMSRAWTECGGDPTVLEAEARRIYDEDVAASRRIGELGSALIPDGARVLTHCNAGALATCELGTALAIVRAAHAQGKTIRVFADETRPVLQGARLTAWELMQDGIDVTLIPDVAVAHLLSTDEIDLAVVGADRIARNGDAANKIGTRGVAAMFQSHGRRPFYVAAPWSTVDMNLRSGREIPIEERRADEVTHVFGQRIAPEGVKVRNPAFDVTSAEWITAIVTDRGIARAPYDASLGALEAK